jgi:hypothetical protein
MTVNIQKAGAVSGLIYQMVVPDFVVKRASGHGASYDVGNGEKGRIAPRYQRKR